MKKIISTPLAPAAIGPYSQGVQTEQMLFISGQLPLDPATGELISETDVSLQTERSIQNLQAILAQAGASLSNVVKTTVFLKDMAHFSEMNQVYSAHFCENCPARSAFQVVCLPKNALVEIEAIAVL